MYGYAIRIKMSRFDPNSVDTSYVYYVDANATTRLPAITSLRWGWTRPDTRPAAEVWQEISRDVTDRRGHLADS